MQLVQTLDHLPHMILTANPEYGPVYNLTTHDVADGFYRLFLPALEFSDVNVNLRSQTEEKE